MIARDNVCPRNYTKPCPDGWSHLENSACVASASYKGACRHMQVFENFNAIEKYKFSLACSAPWPCEDACTMGHDYDSCPLGWVAIHGGFCKSEGEVTPPCMGKYKFDDMSIAQKKGAGHHLWHGVEVQRSVSAELQCTVPTGMDQAARAVLGTGDICRQLW